MGRPSGEGEMWYKDGSNFKGSFKEGFPQKGLFQYPNNTVYNGEIQKYKPHGVGEWTDSIGTFSGNF